MADMTESEREALLGKWIRPSSDDEVLQQERATRMVTDAIAGWDKLSGVSKKIYAKGSYANNTNVRRDSDVDIVVECHDCIYWDYGPGVTQDLSAGSEYTGIWTHALWRSEVLSALKYKFGASSVDSSGNVAIEINAVPGSRPSIDVVPSFQYRRYVTTNRSSYHEGSCVYPKTGERIINWPAQQLKNGREKNDKTGKRYKDFVRALKNAENALAAAGVITPKPSYLMECLIWNMNNSVLTRGSLNEGFKATLAALWVGLDHGATWKAWEEPNRLKYLFRGEKKWTIDDARQVVLETWGLLGYGK